MSEIPIDGIIPSAEDLKKELLNVEFKGEFGEFVVEEEYYEENEDEDYDEDYDDEDYDDEEYNFSDFEKQLDSSVISPQSTSSTDVSRAIILGII